MKVKYLNKMNYNSAPRDDLLDERSDLFENTGEDIMKGIIDPAKDPLMMSPKKINFMLPSKQLQSFIQPEESEEESVREKELSFYAVDGENIEDLVRMQRVRAP